MYLGSNVKPARPRACDHAEVMKVIVTKAIAGNGVDEGDPVRLVTQYWDFDGNLLATNDPCDKK